MPPFGCKKYQNRVIAALHDDVQAVISAALAGWEEMLPPAYPADADALAANELALLAQTGMGGTAPSNPWYGIGIAADLTIAEFVQDFKQLQTKWSALTLNERRQELADIANRPLGKVGVVTVKVTGGDYAPTVNGAFSTEKWRIGINVQKLILSTLSDDAARSLAVTLFHESRHAEQIYFALHKLVVQTPRYSFWQRRPTTPQRAGQMSGLLKAPAYVVSQAQQNALVPGSLQDRWAQAMYDTFFGTGKAHHDAVILTRAQHRNALEQAVREVGKVQADPNATTLEKQMALQALNQAQQENRISYQDYRNLPEEADAHDCGEKVKACW